MTPTIEQLGRLDPVRGLSPARLAELVRLCRCERWAPGSDPLTKQRPGPLFLYLLDGELRIVLPDGAGQVLVGGCDAANWPIGYKTAPPVRSRTITEVQLLPLDFEMLDVMMTWDEMSAAVDFGGQVAQSSSIASTAFSAEVLTGSVLSRLPPAHIHELLQRFQRVPVRRGQTIVREGDAGDYYYLIESGRCRVTRLVGGAQMELAELKTGQAFGEEALVSDSPRSASVTMTGDGVLLRLAKPDFLELLKAPLLRPLARAEAERRVAEGRARWLDVRYPAEFAEDGMPAAVNVPLNEIRTAFGLLDRNREYIVYCQSGRRSSAAAFLLAQGGFQASWLAGGLAATESP